MKTPISTTTLAALAATAVIAACAIPDSDAPAFGKPCDGSCPKGYFCDAATAACLPGEPPPTAVIDAFDASSDDIRPDEELTITWATTDAVSCTLTLPGADAVDVETSGTRTLSTLSAGDVTLTLTCLGGDGVEVTASEDVHVRKLHSGDLILATQADVDANLDVEEVDGAVLANAATLSSVSGMELRIVHGQLVFAAVVGLGALELPALQSVGGTVIVNFNADLLGVSFPQLESIGLGGVIDDDNGSFIIKHCDRLASIDLPRLKSVTGDVAWSTYDYPEFPTNITASPATLPVLAALSAPALESIGGWFDLEDAKALQQLSLPALKTLGGTMVIYGNANMTRIAMPLLESTGTILLDSNGSFAEATTLAIDFGSLTTVAAIDDFQAQLYSRFYDEGLGNGFFRAGDIRLVGNAFTDAGVNPDDNTSIEALDLTSLTSVAGRLEVIGTALTEVDLGALSVIGGLLVTGNDFISGNVTLTALAQVGAHGLVLPNDDTLVGMANLTSVEGRLFLAPASMPVLSSLASVGELDLSALNQADQQNFPVLTDVETLLLDANNNGGNIGTLRLPSVTNVGSLELSGSQLAGAELCGLTTAGTVRILGTSMSTLDGLASLTDVTTLDIKNHSLLPACMVAALAAQTTPTTNTSANNNGVAPDPCELSTSLCP